MHLELSLSAGRLSMSTVGQPGIHGIVTGTQGMGVSTPRAAVVAAATVGLDTELHMPKGGMLATGLESMIVAAMGPPAMHGGPPGMTIRAEGATPKVQVIMAPITTKNPMLLSPC
jgi:hypothetical protein